MTTEAQEEINARRSLAAKFVAKNAPASEEDAVVSRLRATAEILPHDVYSWLRPLLLEAADEIERLRRSAGEI